MSTRTGYMCGVDFQHELDPDHNDSIKIYNSLELLKAERTCWQECGIVKLAIEVESWVEPQDFTQIIVSEAELPLLYKETKEQS